MLKPLAQTMRGIATALRERRRVFWLVSAAIFAFSLAAPVALLSITRKPLDSFSFNPWLASLPEYLRSDAPWGDKLSFLSRVAIGWVNANSSWGVEWSFVLDVPTLARVTVTSLLFGAFFALWSFHRRQGALRAARPAGVAGAITSLLGLSTGPCTLAGCGAPVLPVASLAFTGLSSGTLALVSAVSQIGVAVVLFLIGAAVVWFGWSAGSSPSLRTS